MKETRFGSCCEQRASGRRRASGTRAQPRRGEASPCRGGCPLRGSCAGRHWGEMGRGGFSPTAVPAAGWHPSCTHTEGTRGTAPAGCLPVHAVNGAAGGNGAGGGEGVAKGAVPGGHLQTPGLGGRQGPPPARRGRPGHRLDIAPGLCGEEKGKGMSQQLTDPSTAREWGRALIPISARESA